MNERRPVKAQNHLAKALHPSPRVIKQAMGEVEGFNAKLAVLITRLVGTMWCAYLFTFLALISAPQAFSSGDKIIIVAWVAQTFLQLVLLPIIIVGQNVIQAANDLRAESDHETLVAIHELTKAIDKLQLSQLEILHKLDPKS